MASISDNFNRADEALTAGPWVVDLGSWIVSGNEAFCNDASGKPLAVHTSSLDGNNHRVTANYQGGNGGLLCRASSDGQSGYYCVIFAGAIQEFGRVAAGTRTLISQETAVSVTAGDTIFMECIGSTLRYGKVGGTTVSITDTNITIGTFAGMLSDNSINLDDWTAEDINAPVLQAEGAQNQVTTGTLTLTLPSHQTDDILVSTVLFWLPNTAGSAATIPNLSGWTKAGSVMFPATPDGEVAFFWRRAASGSETNPTFTRGASWDTGTDGIYAGRAYVIRGCDTTGDPWDELDPTAALTAANGSCDAVTVSGPGRTVIQFLGKTDDFATAPTISGWTAGAQTESTTGTDSSFGTFRKENISSSTTADASTVEAVAAGAYVFFGASFKPLPTTGTVAVTQAAQTSSASGTVEGGSGVTGTVAVTQAAQTSSASGQLGYSGTVAVTQAAQTSTASGQLGYSGTVAVTQADQTSTATAQLGYSGTVAETQDAQTSSASGTVGGAGEITGTLAETQGSQTSTATGQLGSSGVLAASQANQTATASGWIEIRGVVAESQDPQTAVAAGQLGSTGTLTEAQDNQTGTAAGWITVTGLVARTQDPQTCAATGFVGVIPTPAGRPLSIPAGTHVVTAESLERAVTVPAGTHVVEAR